MSNNKLKLLTFIILLIFSSSTAVAAPRASRSRVSKAKAPSARSKSAASRLLRNTAGRSNSYYSGINDHEAVAEMQNEMDKEYEEQLEAIKEGRTPPPAKIGLSKQQEMAIKKAALDEKRAKLAEERELKRLEREAKKGERLDAAAERRAKREARKAGKKVIDDAPHDEKSKALKRPKPKATPDDEEKIEEF